MNNLFNLSEEEFRNILKQNDRPLNDNHGDQAVKEIGDRVIIWDYSSVTHINGKELAPWDYDSITDEDHYVVIACNQNNEYNSYFIHYKQDLIVAHPKSLKEYRVSSKHVKLFKQKP